MSGIIHAVTQMDNQSRATCWSVTINMKNVKRETADEWIHEARSKGWRVHGQLEQAPTTGTLHYQLMVETPQTRFSAIKKAFPTAHIEISRNKAALAQYVSKTETRVATLAADNEKYPSVGGFWKLVYRYYDVDDDSGWDQTADDVQFVDLDRQQALEGDPLGFLDIVAGNLIREGYVIDHIITNPAVRSFWKKFHKDVLYRTRETDRQTDTVVLPTVEQTDAGNDAARSICEATDNESCGEADGSSTCSDEGGSDEDSEATDRTSDGE